MTSITPTTILTEGTKIKVKDKLGVVISSKEVKAVPCGIVVVHTVKLTHKVSSSFNRTKIVEIKQQVKDVNYSFIEVM